MKYVVVLGDGMSDRPLKELGDRTPLEAASTKYMDYIAENGRCGLLKTLREGLPLGSDVANLIVLGYDPVRYHPGGRAPLEAASIGIKLSGDETAFRCNLITVEDGRIKDHSGGHISGPEGRQLVNAAGKRFGGEDIKFYPGVSYRNILVLGGRYNENVKCMPPHDIIGQRLDENLVKPLGEGGAETAEFLNDTIKESISLLEEHPVNLRREKRGLSKANCLWFWGQGKRLVMPSFREKYNLDGALISAVDLLKGIGYHLGMEVLDVPGATGYLDTNYEGKADYALNALKKNDFVYVHVESTDEASHEGSIEKKIKALNDLDRRLVGRIIAGREDIDDDVSIAVLPDHATPIKERTHTMDPIPFAIYNPLTAGDDVAGYSEKEAVNGYYGVRDGLDFIKLLLSDND
ncbi:MAG: cofactor-independent phosphoglycerate mutase [Candidatus Altiarchaeota archaeon]|nr:cofactor-independent phosphoglycerate mutase [Candidatus Altiarchaeota archaeon]